MPAIRFPEFRNDGEWCSGTIEKIFNIRNGYTPSKANALFWENGSIPWFRMEDIRKNGHILYDAIQHITPQAVKGRGLIPAYSIMVSTTATIGEHALTIVDSLANQRFTFLTKCKSFEKCIDMLYFHYYMFIIDEWCKRNTNAGGLLSVNMDSFKHLVISYPPTIAEQKRIAGCFNSLDKIIEGTRNKLEQLKEHKKGLMQKLFPAPGKTLPEYRFKEFENDGEWTRFKLKNIASFLKGKGISKTDVSDKARTPCIRYGELYTTYNEVIGTTKSYTNLPLSDLFLSKSNDIIIPASGETAEDIAKASCVLKDGIALGGDINVIRTEHNGVFLAYYLTNIKNNDIARQAQGVSIIHLYNEQLQTLTVELPNNAEQKKIADSLSSIDEAIRLYSNKLDILEQHKQALRQRLFPTI